MQADDKNLEARIVALEYLINVLMDCMIDKDLIDGLKVSRLLSNAASDPESARSNKEVPRCLIELSKRIP